jgi:ABC-2 type transport system permease protein
MMSTAQPRGGSTPGVSALQPRTSGLEPSALWTLFTLTLRQFLRGRRALVLGLLSLLPAGLAMLMRSIEARHGPSTDVVAFVCLFELIPRVLLPLTALLYASGMILDEQEEQTLTYLLIRPLPKWALYVTKLLATMCMVAILGLVFVVITYLAVYVGSGEFLTVFPVQMVITYVVMTLAMMTYAAVFGCLSLLVQRAMIGGIIYIAVIEGVLGNLDFAVRKLSVLYYFRVLAVNWLTLNQGMADRWSIDTGTAPEPALCLLTLLVVIGLATYIGARVFSQREFYVKTPESN